MSGFKSGIFDFAEIRKNTGEPFYASREVKPFIPPAPNVKCTIDPDKCFAEFSGITKTWSKGCTGRCQEC
jgi:hypothetical protein